MLAAVVMVIGVSAGQPDADAPPKTTLLEPKSRLWQATLTPDGKAVVTVTGDERTLKIWDLATNKARTWDKGATDAGSVAFAPDGKSVLVGRRDGTVSRHDFATGKELARVKVGENGREGELFFPLAAGTYGKPRLDMSPDEKLIALDNPNEMTIPIIRWPEGEVMARLKNEPKNGEIYATHVRFGDGGKTLYCLCAGDARGFVAVWDVATGKLSRTLISRRIASHMTVSDDGRWIGVCGGFNRVVTAWDSKADFKQIELPIPAVNCWGIAFSRDGKQTASVSTYSMGRKGAMAVVWDLTTGRPTRTWAVSDDYWLGGIVFFSHDGQTLFTGGQSEGLLAWDLYAPKK